MTLVRVDGDTEEAGVGVDQLILVSDHGDPEDTSVTEESEVSHVLVDLKWPALSYVPRPGQEKLRSLLLLI